MILSSESEISPEESIGKIAIGVFITASSLCFLTVKYVWYRKFYRRLSNANRDIKLDIDEKNKSYMRKFTLVRSISTICTFLKSTVLCSFDWLFLAF